LAGKRTVTGKKAGKQQTVVFLLLLFASLAVAVALVSPPGGFMTAVGEYLGNSLGLLSVFVPLVLFLTGALTIGLGFSKRWLAVTGATFICCFFFSAMVTTILCRIRPELLYFAGGQLTAKTVIALDSLAGGIISWIAFFILFMMSLVVFTEWNISADLSSILGRRAKAPGRTGSSKQKLIIAEVDTPVPDGSSDGRNPWVPRIEPGEAQFSPPRETPSETRAVTRQTERESKDSEVKSGIRPITPTGSTSGDEDPYRLPGPDFLSMPSEGERRKQSKAEIEENAALLVQKLADFGVECTVADYCPGPVLTRYELTPGTGVKVNRILNLADDLALALAAKRIRILAPIPGKGAVGIEVPNRNPETVYLREIISRFTDEKIPVALGKKLEGQPFIADLTDMPHLLIAGATGSGKSVCVHAIISTILLTRTPHQVKLALVDPKMLELSAYKGIPHLWSPVVVQSTKARFLLDALVREMEERYDLLARSGVRSIDEYNRRFGPEESHDRLPYIVVVIDELADLMMVSARDVEQPITRLAQMARAVGIHLVVATQRPSVDVITGIIKANFPSRIAFNVQSKTDSRTILDMNGAEKLLGKGDMLFVPAGAPEPIRVHGSFVSTEETKALVDFWKLQPEIPFEYEPPDDEGGNLYDPGELDFDDPLLEDVKDSVVAEQRASVSMIQRKFRVGYARAGKLIDMLERMGVVGPHLGSKPREVLVRQRTEEEHNE